MPDYDEEFDLVTKRLDFILPICVFVLVAISFVQVISILSISIPYMM